MLHVQRKFIDFNTYTAISSRVLFRATLTNVCDWHANVVVTATSGERVFHVLNGRGDEKWYRSLHATPRPVSLSTWIRIVREITIYLSRCWIFQLGLRFSHHHYVVYWDLCSCHNWFSERSKSRLQNRDHLLMEGGNLSTMVTLLLRFEGWGFK